jgi:ferric-dicitrate binding protein FerR (iron transport regulator)
MHFSTTETTQTARFDFKRVLKRALAVTVAVAMVVGNGLPVFAVNSSARTINVLRIDGSDVMLSRGAQMAPPRAGQRLVDGNVITTGRDSFVYLVLDGESIVKMDQSSSLLVASSRSQLSLNIQSGSALVNAAPQATGHTLETRAGNVGMVVRGTMYTMGRSEGGDTSVVMLSGSGDVNGRPLEAGQMMIVRQRTDSADAPDEPEDADYEAEEDDVYFFEDTEEDEDIEEDRRRY